MCVFVLERARVFFAVRIMPTHLNFAIGLEPLLTPMKQEALSQQRKNKTESLKLHPSKPKSHVHALVRPKCPGALLHTGHFEAAFFSAACCWSRSAQAKQMTCPQGGVRMSSGSPWDRLRGVILDSHYLRRCYSCTFLWKPPNVMHWCWMLGPPISLQRPASLV